MSEQDVLVELFYDSAWQDHTVDVDMDRADIRITQGATDAYSHAQPSSCQLVFDNRDGTFHPQNPNSSLFGLIGRNTPIRVSVEGDVRFSGEVASWTPRRGVKKDAWVNVVANGISRRLGQGSTPLKSSLATLTPTGVDGENLLAYWPCEDGPSASRIAPGLTGLDSMKISGDVEPAATAPLVATEELPDLNDGSLVVAAPAGGSTVTALWEIPSGGLTDDALLYRLDMTDEGIFGELRYRSSSDGQVQATITDQDGSTNSGSVSNVTDGLDGGVWVIQFTTQHVPALSDSAVRARLWPVADDGTQGDRHDDSLVVLGENLDGGTISRITAGGGLGGGVVGHVCLITLAATSSFPFNIDGSTTAYLREPAGDRVERLCDQENITVTVTGTADDTQAMGAQRVDSLLSLLRECAVADSGILHDAVTQLGFTYRTGRSLYSQDAALTLDWDAGEIAEPLEPVTDDRNVRNDVTVRRPDGSSARAVRESGSLSVQDPPDGVGRYDTRDEVNVVSDGVLENQAGWRLHLGTVDEIRFPRVSIDLDAGTQLASDVNAVRPGDRLDLVNLPPEHVAVDEASLLVLGWTARVGIHKRKITFNCTPEAPYRIAEVGGGAVLGTVGSVSATLNEDLDTTETAVDITCGVGPDWGHEGTDYDITVGGERMTVTAAGAVSGSFPNRTQTLTATRSVNGIVKSHSSGDPISMAEPSYIGL